jgi:hypothetical protein
MGESSDEVNFHVWGVDRESYGPVELPVLVSWVKDGRVTAETWVFASQRDAWQRAAELPELQMFFRAKPREPGGAGAGGGPDRLEARFLRRVKVLGALADEQLERFASFLEVQKVPQWSVVVKQGEPGDSLFLILEGELRVRINVAGRETILATLSVGEFFGDISIFDQGPRSADVVANKDSLLVKVSAKAVQLLIKEAPETAAPFIFALGKTLAARIRVDNKRLGDTLKFSGSF